MSIANRASSILLVATDVGLASPPQEARAEEPVDHVVVGRPRSEGKGTDHN